jgi:hypothetical protein
VCKINLVIERINLNGENHVQQNNFMSHYDRQQTSQNCNGQNRNSIPAKVERGVGYRLQSYRIRALNDSTKLIILSG